ncbi:MAG: T9SS type A sorting domain-containing protein [Bacteroidales bacterium]|nr:T9SS type A sorting domain-containing protein [Bacteroidales bacterium]
MKTLLFSIVFLFISIKAIFPQGLPPGWDYVPTPTTHIISIPLACNPKINDYSLQPGDYIGVFYVNGSGGLSCGGAIEWTGIQNTGIIAFGNDSFTPEKDGFFNNEVINYKVYSWSVQNTYDAVVTCNPNLPNTCLNFVPNGLSGLASLDASGFYIVVEASETSICSGTSVQLNAIPSGGSGGYTYSWTSVPVGFSSNIANPTVSPAVTTEYFCQVTNGSNSLTAKVLVEVIPAPVAISGADLSICDGETAQLNGVVENATSFSWSSSGDGTFSNSAVLNPVYTPGPNDILSGAVQLCLTATSVPACPESSDCLILTIYPLPVVTLNAFPDYCSGDPAFDLYGGSPGGGIYYVNGIPSVVFSPSDPGIYNIVYEYVNANGCSDTAMQQLIVHPLPVVECPDDFTVCCNSSPIQLNSATPPGGIYSGNGVIGGVFTPDCNNTGNFPITYAYTDPNTSCENSCSFVITVAPLPVVACPSNYQVCINTPAFALTGAIPSNGSYSGPGVNQNIFYPAIAGIGIHQITYNYTDPNGCPGSCFFTIQVNPLPSVNAGFPQVFIILPTTTVILSDATAANFTAIQWSTSGSGTFNDPTLINPEYTLSDDDILAGSVELTLTGINDCGSVSDNIEIIINECQPAVVDAGEDGTICEDAVFTISDANALFYESLLWSNNGGDGQFNDPTLLNPSYTPGENDIEAGSVLLTLTAYPLEVCDTVTDSKLLTIVLLPAAYSGLDQTICEDGEVSLSGEAYHHSFILWTTNGDGAFEDPEDLQTQYYPGVNDIAFQEVVITLTVFPLAPCAETANDEMMVSITKLPQVDAGDDVTIPVGETLQLSAVASDYFLVLWSTSGDGTFNAYDILNPIYTPGTEDIQNAGATLALTAFPLAPCTIQITDDLELSIDTLTTIRPFANEGKVRIYPNPATTEIFIHIGHLPGNELKIELFDLNGRVVFEENLKRNGMENEFRYSISTSEFPIGVYMIRLKNEHFYFLGKIKLIKS